MNRSMAPTPMKPCFKRRARRAFGTLRTTLAIAATTLALAPTVAFSAPRNADLENIELPVQNYAVIDLSGSVQGDGGVKLVTLSDDGSAVFCFLTNQGVESEHRVHRWALGKVSAAPLTVLRRYQQDPTLGWQEWGVTALALSGLLSGMYQSDWDTFSSEPMLEDDGSLFYGSTIYGFTGSTSGIGTPAPFYISEGHIEGWVCGSENGAYAAFYCDFSAIKVGNDLHHYDRGINYRSMNFLQGGGATHLFYGDDLPSGVSNLPGVIRENFSIRSINNHGWAVGNGNEGAAPKLWNGTALLSIGAADDSAADLNEQNQVVVQGPYGGEGYLWESGPPKLLVSVLAKMVKEQVTHAQPLSISNQVDAASDKTIRILSDAEDKGHPKADGSPSIQKLLWTRDNAPIPKWTAARIQLPEGTQITGWNTINKNGLIAALGSPPPPPAAPGSSPTPAPSPSPTPTTHALLLVPVDIAVKKKGQQAPKDGVGVLVEKTEVLEIALAPNWFDQDKQLEKLITWQYRQIKGDGTFTGWAAFGNNGKGTKFEDASLTALPGIYQIKAVISNGGQTQEYQYVRKKDDKYGADSHGKFNEIYRKGKPDYVGVAEGGPQASIVKTAQAALGSTAWSESATITLSTGFGAKSGDPKCNIFDYQEVVAAGSAMPVDSGGSPPRAYDLWNSSFAMSGWAYHDGMWYPVPGSLVARYKGQWLGFRLPGTHAHCGILDYDGAWINAGSVNVNRFPHLTDGEYQTAHFRSN